MGIGEIYCRLMAKCAVKVGGHLAMNACVINFNLCASLPAGTEGAVHAVRQQWDANESLTPHQEALLPRTNPPQAVQWTHNWKTVRQMNQIHVSGPVKNASTSYPESASCSQPPPLVCWPSLGLRMIMEWKEKLPPLGVQWIFCYHGMSSGRR